MIEHGCPGGILVGSDARKRLISGPGHLYMCIHVIVCPYLHAYELCYVEEHRNLQYGTILVACVSTVTVSFIQDTSMHDEPPTGALNRADNLTSLSGGCLCM